jgi:hypothetical protein
MQRQKLYFLDSINLIDDINKFRNKDVFDLMNYIKERYNISCCHHEYYTID